MKDDKRAPANPSTAAASLASVPHRILGSLRDALAAASRDDRTAELTVEQPTGHRQAKTAAAADAAAQGPGSVHAGPAPPTSGGSQAKSSGAAGPAVKAREEPTQRTRAGAAARTQLVRGKPKVKRGDFHQDPVVGWLVVIGGPGLGAFRPIFEGNNAIGRSKSQRIPIDFGDDTISSEEQAYIRYDSVDRSFLFVPNLAKTNVVSLNDQKPTGATQLQAMDVITMGRTQLAFVPFCGEEFDWSELSELKE
jgi:hypothetical protein